MTLAPPTHPNEIIAAFRKEATTGTQRLVADLLETHMMRADHWEKKYKGLEALHAVEAREGAEAAEGFGATPSPFAAERNPTGPALDRLLVKSLAEVIALRQENRALKARLDAALRSTETP